MNIRATAIGYVKIWYFSRAKARYLKSLLTEITLSLLQMSINRSRSCACTSHASKSDPPKFVSARYGTRAKSFLCVSLSLSFCASYLIFCSAWRVYNCEPPRWLYISGYNIELHQRLREPVNFPKGTWSFKAFGCSRSLSVSCTRN